jgi:uncharacterized protein
MSSQNENSSSSEERLTDEFRSANSDSEFFANIGEAESAELADSWQKLGESLRQLPVTTADGLAARVQHEIRATQMTGGEQQSSPYRSTIPQRSYHFGRAAALLATSCAVMVVAATIVAYQANTPPSATAVAFRSLDPKQWEVVVVTGTAQRLNLITAELRDAVDQRGLEIHSLSEGKRPANESMELLMASGESSVEFLEALSADDTDVEAEWNPDQISGFDRDELLSRFAESMQTPTQSDQFFGEVFVVLPKEHSIQVSTVPPGTIGEDSGNRIAKQDGSDSHEPPSESVDSQVARLLDRKTDRPVLVIFRRKPATLDDVQGYMDSPAANRDSV